MNETALKTLAEMQNMDLLCIACREPNTCCVSFGMAFVWQCMY